MAAVLVLFTVFQDELEIGEYYEDCKIVKVTDWVPEKVGRFFLGKNLKKNIFIFKINKISKNM